MGESGQVKQPEKANSRGILSFGQFRSLFHKNYKTKIEEALREKLYLGRAFRAFTSRISYLWNLSSSYLRVNHMSDWTRQEMRRIFLRPKKLKRRPSDRFEERVDHGPIEGRASIETDDDALDGMEVGDKSLEHIKKRGPKDGPAMFKITIGGNRVVRDNADEILPASQESMTIQMKRFMNKLISSRLGDEVNKMDQSELTDKVFVDLRSTQCLGPIRDQGTCGSCYIFSTLSLYEYAHCRSTGKQVHFSEQYVIDCGKRIEMEGCEGGEEEEVSEFVNDYGLELYADYPSLWRDAQCAYRESLPAKQMGSIRMNAPELKTVELADIEKHLMYGFPVLFTIVASDEYLDYGGGVHELKECIDDELHSILAVGSGRANGHEYWLLRNTLGPDWGEDGYYRLRKDSPCIYETGQGITLEASTFRSRHNPFEAYRFHKNPNHDKSAFTTRA